MEGMTSSSSRLPDESAPVGAGVAFKNPKSGISRRTVMTGAAWTVPVLIAAGAAPAQAASQCQNVGTIYNAHAYAKFLSGVLGYTNLDTIASVVGVNADVVATPQNPQEHYNVLAVNALQSINVDLTGTGSLVSGILSTVAPANTAALGQYAYANEIGGHTRGAAGLVSQGGQINFTQSSSVAELADLDLKKILENLVGGAAGGVVSNVADLKLSIGAVASKAEIDPTQCTTELNVLRQYLVSYIKLVVKSALVGNLVSPLSTILGGLQATLDSTAVATAIKNALSGVLGPVLGGLAGSVLGPLLDALVIKITVQQSAVDALLTQWFPAGTGKALQMKLDEGTAVVDLGPLLGHAYDANGNSLNGLAPNTRLFSGAELPTVSAAQLVDDWVDGLVDAILGLIDVEITANLTVPAVASVVLSIKGTVNQILTGASTSTIKLTNPLTGITILNVNLAPLVGPIGQAIKDIVKNLFGSSGPLQAALSALNQLLASIFDLLANVVAITLNAQNRLPGQPNGMPYTPLWNAGGYGNGGYEVAAIHLGLLNAPNVGLLNLFLARSGVGSNTPRTP